MVKKSAVDNALSVFLKNPYWKKVYDDAPSENSKRHCALSFYNSWYFGSRDGIAEQHRLEKKLTEKDWEYLLRYSANNPFRMKCRENIKRLQRAQEGQMQSWA